MAISRALTMAPLGVMTRMKTSLLRLETADSAWIRSESGTVHSYNSTYPGQLILLWLF